MPNIRIMPLPGLFLTPAPLHAEPQFLPLMLPEASALFLIDIAHVGAFGMMTLAVLCLPWTR